MWEFYANNLSDNLFHNFVEMGKMEELATILSNYIVYGGREFLYSYLFNEYPMWRFEHTFEEKLLPTRMSIDLLKGFTSFPILTLIYLSHYPEEQNVIKKVLHIITWTFLFGFIEYISKMFGMISYHHGWNMWWSLFFDFAMFSILAVHYKRPIIAWILSGLFTLFLWEVFHINFELLK